VTQPSSMRKVVQYKTEDATRKMPCWWGRNSAVHDCGPHGVGAEPVSNAGVFSSLQHHQRSKAL